MRTGRFCHRSSRLLARELCLGDPGNRGSGIEAEGKEGAHDACEDGDSDSFAEVEVGLAGFGLLFRRDLLLLGPAGCAVDGRRR